MNRHKDPLAFVRSDLEEYRLLYQRYFEVLLELLLQTRGLQTAHARSYEEAAAKGQSYEQAGLPEIRSN